MATTTTNFGWDIPQSTDLVKDGATAIAALGQDIDTALVDLKGGTTGQVLAKASGADLDFSWVAQDDSNAIQNAIVDAKGDLISATAADTPARLAVGTNGQVLTADSTAATGLKWASASSGGMTLLSTTTLSGTSTSITSIDQTYVDLIIRIYDPIINGAGGISATLNSNSAANTYQRVDVQSFNGSNTAITGASAASFAPYTSSMSNTSKKNFIEITIPSYTDTSINKVIKIYNCVEQGSDVVAQYGTTNFRSTTAVSSIQINTNATSWNSGTVRIYGVK
jgi:hypothetical protein